jgi:hypothetical protein
MMLALLFRGETFSHDALSPVLETSPLTHRKLRRRDAFVGFVIHHPSYNLDGSVDDKVWQI